MHAAIEALAWGRQCACLMSFAVPVDLIEPLAEEVAVAKAPSRKAVKKYVD